MVRQINEDEAAVVRRIFTLCADGAGLTRITKTLNEEGASGAARAAGAADGLGRQQRAVRAAAPALSRRDRLEPDPQARQLGTGASSRAARRPNGCAVPAPELQIVSDELWTAAHARFAERQQKHTGGAGRRRDIESRYLLSGFARCGSAAAGSRRTVGSTAGTA